MDQSIIDKTESYLSEQIETLKLFNADSEFAKLLDSFRHREGVIQDGLKQGLSREHMERLTLKHMKWSLGNIGIPSDEQIMKDLDVAIGFISDN